MTRSSSSGRRLGSRLVSASRDGSCGVQPYGAGTRSYRLLCRAKALQIRQNGGTLMCGIAGVYLRDPKLSVNLDALLDTMLDAIEHRGGDATGYLALNPEGVAEWHRAACDVPDFKKYRRPVPEGTRTILAHTRWATQGLPAFIENNHPIRRGPFYVIHNGHV